MMMGGRLRACWRAGVLAIGALALAGCFAPAPPGPASLSVGPNPAGFPTLGPPYNPMPKDTVTVTNTGGHTAIDVMVNGVGVYSVPSSNCSTLAPGASCQAQIQFCPSTSGTYDNTLTVTGTDATTGASLQGTTQLMGNAT